MIIKSYWNVKMSPVIQKVRNLTSNESLSFNKHNIPNFFLHEDHHFIKLNTIMIYQFHLHCI